MQDKERADILADALAEAIVYISAIADDDSPTLLWLNEQYNKAQGE